MEESFEQKAWTENFIKRWKKSCEQKFEIKLRTRVVNKSHEQKFFNISCNKSFKKQAGAELDQAQVKLDDVVVVVVDIVVKTMV